MGHFPTEYALLLRQMWDRGRGFMNIEQDVMVTAEVLDGFKTCPEPWCTVPIPRHRPPHEPLPASLGCVRFAEWLVKTEPDLLRAACRISVNGQEPGHWKGLDTAIEQELRGRGYEPHVHQPPLVHLPPLAACYR